MRRIPGLIGLADADLVVVFNPGTPDRTAAIEGRGPSPLPWLGESARLLQEMGAAHVAYPCNTAHYFLHRATPEELPLRVPLIDMIAETAAAAAAAGCRRAGLLATSGTIRTDLYQNALNARGLDVIVPSTVTTQPGNRRTDSAGRVPLATYHDAGAHPGTTVPDAAFASLAASLVASLGEQEGLVMEAIVGALGIKAGYTMGVAPQLAADAARRLVQRGAELLVLGCTELPLVLTGAHVHVEGRTVPLIDSTRVVADSLRHRSGCHGIAGGLGSEATVDLLEKMDAPADFTGILREILRATVDALGARRDQDHLKMFAIIARDPVEAAGRLKQAGADFLILAPSAAAAVSAVEAASGLPVFVARPRHRTGSEVVRHAAPDEF